MKGLALNKCARLVIPHGFQAGKLMDFLSILNTGLCEIGVRGQGEISKLRSFLAVTKQSECYLVFDLKQ